MTTDACLDEHAALAYLDGGGERDAIAIHVDRCGDCRLLLLALARVDSPALADTDVAISPTMPANKHVDPLDPVQIARFRILGRLGAGAMGVVYHAEDPDLRRPVAIKVVRDGLAGSIGSTRMLREAQAMARLDHANVIRVYEVGTDDAGDLYIAMEYVAGTTLAVWLRTPRSWRVIVDAYLQAAAGLAAAHALGIVHRDFKPDNVMIDAAGKVKVGDFGLARAVDSPRDEPEPAGSPLAASMTLTGTMVGTPLYMSPEQLHGAPADARGDQFALCVALYEALYGARPFAGKTIAELRAATARGPQRPALRGGAAALWPVLRRGLAPRPEDRFRDVPALLAAIARARRAPRRRILVAIAAAAAVTAAAFGTAVALRRDPPPDPTAAVWNPARAVELREAMLRSSKRPAAFVTDQANRVVAEIDRWLTGWRTASAAVDGDRDAGPAIAHHRRACLDLRLRELGEVIRDIATATDDRIESTLPMLSAMRAPATCFAAIPPRDPVPPVDEARVAELELAIDLADLRDLAGDARAAAAAIDRLEGEVRVLRDARLLAHAMFVRGVATEGDRARAALVEAAGLAPATGDSVLEAKILLALVIEATSARVDLALAHKWAGAAEQVVSRARLDPGLPRDEVDALEAGLAAALANVAHAEGDYKGVLTHRERQVAMARSARGEQSRMYAQALASLGRALLALDRPDDARSALERSVAALRDALGPHHPMVGDALVSLATLRVTRADLDGARRDYEAALAVLAAAYGPRDARCIPALAGLANIEHTTGRPEDTVRHATEVVEIARATYGDGAADLAMPLLLVANAQLELGNVAAARKALDEASAIEVRVHGKQHPSYAKNLATRALIEMAAGDYPAARSALDGALAVTADGASNWPFVVYLAELDLVEGKHAAALERFRRVRRELTARYGAEYPPLNAMLGGEGRALVGLGRYRDALPLLERADAMAKQNNARGPDVGASRVALSRAIVAVRRDRERALEVARSAREELVLTAGQPGGRAALAEATTWLDELAGPPR